MKFKKRCPGKYAQIGSAKIYYETYGRGEPLFWLHGGLSCIDGLRFQIPFFSRHFKVILPERPGHGHTADIAGNYSYEAMADQTLSLMKNLKINRASFAGYSDGANLLLWFAAKYPARVKKIVLVGGNYHHHGCDPLFQRDLKNQNPKKYGIDPRYQAYSPDAPEHYFQVFEKCRKLWLTEPKWKPALLKKIRCPVLVMAGDKDMIKPEHSVAMLRLIKKAQLAILPGTTHSLLKEKSALANRMILDFLNEP
ncbi:MAG TPA: alpha/beta hydrolase [Candidatus Omnitrophota bacterium]|nr:alpha/beta hydrolase [Candidatus Omnitrophota bacterium]